MAHYSPATLAYVLFSALALLATASPVRRVRQEHLFSQESAHGSLKFTGQKTGVSAYTEKLFVHMMYTHANHRIIKNGGWALTEMDAYSEGYSTTNPCSQTHHH